MESPPMVAYEGMDCANCGRPLFIQSISASAQIFCESCGVLQSVETTKCRGRTCKVRVFFGGKSGRVPVNVNTGANHFLDCVDAKSFRSRK